VKRNQRKEACRVDNTVGLLVSTVAVELLSSRKETMPSIDTKQFHVVMMGSLTEPVIHTTDDTGMNIGQRWNDIDRRKSCPNATLSCTNQIWTVLVAKPGLCSEKPANFCV
jgi:hypothetical protein